MPFSKHPRKELSAMNKIVEDSFQAFLTENAHFTSIEEYPIIPCEMVSKELPKKIMPFNKALKYQGKLDDIFVCTFSPDKTFERVRRNPQKYVSFLKRTAGLIGFDFSIHSDMPVIKQKSQINDNLSLTYYYGDQGIPIIPNLRCGIDELIPEYFEALPQYSTFALGVHGFVKETQEQWEWYYFIDRVIKELHPKSLIVYGHLNSKIFEDFTDKTNIVQYNSWISDRWKEVLACGN